MRRWEELNKQYADKGLRFITAYSQFQPLDVIEAEVKKMKLTLPVATDGYYASRFFAPTLCVIWVIGVDGKVVHVGQEGWEEAALRELRKVKYPGLSGAFAAPMEPAAKAYGEGKLAEADRLAQLVEDGEHDESTLKQAAELRLKIAQRRKLLEVRADTAEVSGDYDLALACWREIGARFGEIEYERSPREESGRILKLDELEPERKARRAFINARQKAWNGIDGSGKDVQKAIAAYDAAIKLMEDFLKEHKGRRPEALAREMIDAWKAWKEELEPAKESK